MIKAPRKAFYAVVPTPVSVQLPRLSPPSCQYIHAQQKIAVILFLIRNQTSQEFPIHARVYNHLPSSFSH